MRIRFGPVPPLSSTGGLRPLLYVYDYTEGRENPVYVSETVKDQVKYDDIS